MTTTILTTHRDEEMNWRRAYEDLAARERQKDREIEKLTYEVSAMCAIVAQCREDLQRATSSLNAQRDALQELLLGYSPAEHTDFVFAPEGTVLRKGSWIVQRRAA